MMICPTQSGNLDQPSFRSRGEIVAVGYRELHFNGRIEFGLQSDRSDSDDRGRRRRFHLPYELPVVEFAALASWAHQVRAEAGAPTAEYVIDVQITTKSPCELINRTLDYPEPFGFQDTGCTHFPRYSLGDVAEIPSLLDAFEQDFLNTFGQELPTQLGGLMIEEQGEQP